MTTGDGSEASIVPALDTSLHISDTQCESSEHGVEEKKPTLTQHEKERIKEEKIKSYHELQETILWQEYSSDVTQFLSDPLALPSSPLSPTQREESSSISDNSITESSSEFGDVPEVNGEDGEPVNEVVTGLWDKSMPINIKQGESFNVGVNPSYPQQLVGSFGGDSYVLTSSGWPSHFLTKSPTEPHFSFTNSSDHSQVSNFEPEYSQEDMNNHQQISMVESFTVQDNIQQVQDRQQGCLVIGRQRSDSIVSLNDLQDLISDPNDFVEKGIDALDALNPLITDVHHDPGNEITFRTKVKVSQEKYGHRQTITTESKSVSDPAEKSTCPEAFDGRQILKHLNFYHREYADVINIPSSKFKSLLKSIKGRVPKRRNHSLTWDAAIITICLMRNLVQEVVEGLKSNDRIVLASSIECGLNRLANITERACYARVLKYSPIEELP